MPSQDQQMFDRVDLQLMSSLRIQAEEASAQEGLSLSEFLSAAVAEKLERHAEQMWLKNRRPPTKESLAEALAILNRPDSRAPDPGDELPEGYVRLGTR